MLLAASQLVGCSKSSGPKASGKTEAPISGSPSDAPVEFKAQWKTGQRYAFHLDVVHHSKTPRETKRNLENPGAAFSEMETTFGEDYALSVTNELHNGHRQLELQILSLQLDVAMGDQYVLNFDSENKVAPANDSPVPDALKQLIGGKLGVELSSHNKLVKTDGGRELMDKALGERPDNRAEGMLRRIFSPQNVRQMVELSGLPDKPVKIGDSWPAKRELAGNQTSIPVELNCTFKGWQQHENRKCALVEFSGAITGGDTSDKDRRRSGNKSDAGNGKVESGKMEGRMWFDPQLGMITETVVDSNLTVNSGSRRSKSTNAPPETALTTMSQTISLKLADVTPLAGKLEAKN